MSYFNLLFRYCGKISTQIPKFLSKAGRLGICLIVPLKRSAKTTPSEVFLEKNLTLFLKEVLQIIFKKFLPSITFN